MRTIITEISKYLLLALMVFFTIDTYMVLRRRDEVSRRRIMRSQIGLMVLFNLTAFLNLFIMSGDIRMLFMLGMIVSYILIVQILYRLIYRRASLILLNTMCMIMSVGFVIQARLGMETAIKQFIIAVGSTLICFIIPVVIRRMRMMSQLGWVYGIVGIVLLAGVFLFGRVTGGANLNLTIGGISFQFSEFVKITVVLFMAGMLQYRHDFARVVLVTVVAAVHVGILALSADLGAALIYFVAYIVMVFVATRNPGYVLLGLGGMAGASTIAYRLFAHVRTRVQVWRDPFADYEGTGYQIIQALFGVCAGGWFGTGLFQGNPEMIPLAYEDFTFAAICEELGILFAICLLLLCMGMYLLIVSISMKLENPFYRLVAIGLGTEYAFQVFLTVGGTTKFIPMTGITLPLVSYGGSSIMCTIIMISIIQGLYIMRKDESDEIAEEIARMHYEERMLRQAEERERRRRPVIRRNRAEETPDRRRDEDGGIRRERARSEDRGIRRERLRSEDGGIRRERAGSEDGGIRRERARSEEGRGAWESDGRRDRRRSPENNGMRRISRETGDRDSNTGIGTGGIQAEDGMMYDLKKDVQTGSESGRMGAEEYDRTQGHRGTGEEDLSRRIEEEARKGLRLHN